MSGSFKDAFRKKGLAPAEPVAPKTSKKKWQADLPDDETRLPQFDAPALIVPTETPRTTKRTITPKKV